MTPKEVLVSKAEYIGVTGTSFCLYGYSCFLVGWIVQKLIRRVILNLGIKIIALRDPFQLVLSQGVESTKWDIEEIQWTFTPFSWAVRQDGTKWILGYKSEDSHYSQMSKS